MTEYQKQQVLEYLKQYTDVELHHGDCVGVDAEVAIMAKELGYRIKRSPSQTDAGKAFWDKNRGEEGQLSGKIVETTTDKPLDREDRVVRVGDCLTLGRLADQTFAVLGKGDDRGRRTRTFGIFDDLGLAVFHDRNAGVGRAQVDADDLAHDSKLRAMSCGVLGLWVPGRAFQGPFKGFSAVFQAVRAIFEAIQAGGALATMTIAGSAVDSRETARP